MSNKEYCHECSKETVHIRTNQVAEGLLAIVTLGLSTVCNFEEKMCLECGTKSEK